MTNAEILWSLFVFYEKKLDPEQAKIYLRLLSGIDSGELQEAADFWMKTSQWFPKVSELLALIRSGRANRVIDPDELRRHDFWAAMSALGQVARGEIPHDDLFNEPRLRRVIGQEPTWETIGDDSRAWWREIMHADGRREVEPGVWSPVEETEAA